MEVAVRRTYSVSSPTLHIQKYPEDRKSISGYSLLRKTLKCKKKLVNPPLHSQRHDQYNFARSELFYLIEV